MKYEIWSNVTEPNEEHVPMLHGYKDGDVMKKTWEGVMPHLDHANALDIFFEMFNRDDRPNREVAHSLSIGDIVVLDDEAYSCEPIGWNSCETRGWMPQPRAISRLTMI